MRILVSGGTGMIGTALREAAERAGHETGLLVRGEPEGPRQWRWAPADGQVPDAAIAWADAVVNLSGASIGRLPWTRSYRRELVLSRVTATRTLVEAIHRAVEPPAVLVNASGVGFYGDRPGERLDEHSGPGRGFLAYVCRRWEAEAQEAQDITRVATVRTGLVLGDGGALAPLVLATRFGLGARVGQGTQVWPWVALDDVAGGILHVVASSVSGPVNLVAPAHATSEDVTRALAEVMHRPHRLVLPGPLLRVPLGPAADELLLLSQDVEPAALLRSGYRFRLPDLRAALEVALRGGSSGGSIDPGHPTTPPGAAPAAEKVAEHREEEREPRHGSPSTPQSSSEDLAALTVAELRQRARARGLTGYSRRTKAELIEMLESS